MLGIAVMFFAGLWLLVIIIAMWIGMWIGWKIARAIIPTGGMPIRILAGLIGMALGFYVSVGFYIRLEWVIYHREKALVETFCSENPRIEVFITPEELAQITAENIHKYDPYRYELLEKESFYHDDRIIFQGTRYEKFDLGIDYGFEYFQYSLNTGQSILRKSIYVDSNRRLILSRITSAKAIGNFSPNILGEKPWFGNIHDCELTKEERSMDDNLFIRFKHIMENAHDQSNRPA